MNKALRGYRRRPLPLRCPHQAEAAADEGEEGGGGDGGWTTRSDSAPIRTIEERVRPLTKSRQPAHLVAASFLPSSSDRAVIGAAIGRECALRCAAAEEDGREGDKSISRR